MKFARFFFALFLVSSSSSASTAGRSDLADSCKDRFKNVIELSHFMGGLVQDTVFERDYVADLARGRGDIQLTLKVGELQKKIDDASATQAVLMAGFKLSCVYAGAVTDHPSANGDSGKTAECGKESDQILIDAALQGMDISAEVHKLKALQPNLTEAASDVEKNRRQDASSAALFLKLDSFVKDCVVDEDLAGD